MLAIMAALMACASLSRADIVSNSIAADGSGVMSCYTYGFLKTGDHTFQLDIDGSHNSWNVGHIQGGIYTDTGLTQRSRSTNRLIMIPGPLGATITSR